jgi:hypothetical protein
LGHENRRASTLLLSGGDMVIAFNRRPLAFTLLEKRRDVHASIHACIHACIHEEFSLFYQPSSFPRRLIVLGIADY